MTSDTVGFAILGPGIVADLHQRAIEANADVGARLVAVGYHNAARFAEIEGRFGAPCLSEADLLAHPGVDVICICTPSHQHAAQTIAAARTGKHVLVEKPMAIALADADAMIAACQQAGVKLAVTVQRRAEPLFQRVARAIRAGDLGTLTHAVVTVPYTRNDAYFAQADWRGTWAGDGGGVLMNQGIHLIDLLVWYMGDPVSIQAQAATLSRPIEVEDTLVATLRFANGALATVAATTTAEPGFPHRIEIYGTGGGIQIEGEAVVRWSLLDPASAKVEPPQMGAPAATGAGSDPRGIAATGHAAMFRDFIAAVREDRAPLVDGAEGRRSLAAVLAIYRAAGLNAC